MQKAVSPSSDERSLNDAIEMERGHRCPHRNQHGSADQATLILMQQALAKRDAELPARVVQAVTLAKKQRKLA